MKMAFKLQGDKLFNTPIIIAKDKKKRIYVANFYSTTP